MYIDYYQYLALPLLSDRYWFLRGYVEESGAETRFRWEILPKNHPHQKFYHSIKKKYPNAVEVPRNIGAWVFIQRPMNNEVRYYVCTNPGGSVPESLQSVGTEKTLPDNLNDLILESKKRAP